MPAPLPGACVLRAGGEPPGMGQAPSPGSPHHLPAHPITAPVAQPAPEQGAWEGNGEPLVMEALATQSHF